MCPRMVHADQEFIYVLTSEKLVYLFLKKYYINKFLELHF